MLTAKQVKAIKAALWQGVICEVLGKRFRVSTAQVGHIRTGKRWAEVRWPDGKSGGLGKARAGKIAKARRIARLGRIEP